MQLLECIYGCYMNKECFYIFYPSKSGGVIYFNNEAVGWIVGDDGCFLMGFQGN